MATTYRPIRKRGTLLPCVHLNILSNNLLCPHQVPYRPMVTDRYTGHVIPAWPDLDIKKEDEEASKKGLCTYCSVEDATRVCDQCYGEEGDYVSYCFGCFAMVHQKDLQKRDHTYTLKEETVTGKVSCTTSHCASFGLIRCLLPSPATAMH
jgi:hypothetical protein